MLQLNDNTLAGGFQSRLNALSLRLEGMGYPAVGVASGRRSKSLQEQIFRDRYRRQDSGSGPYGDVRWWDGDGDGRRERWVRVKSGGTVLPPGDSTHEDPPATGADLSWPYNNRYTAAHAGLVAICGEYGIRWTGVDFGEDWHFDSIWDPYTAFAASEAKPFQEDDMYTDADRARDERAAKDASDVKQALLNGSKYDSSTSPLDRIEAASVEARDRIRGPQSVPWDYVQRMSSILEGIANAGTSSDVNVPALLSEVESRLAATFQQQFDEFSVSIRAEIITELGRADLPAEIEAAVDAAIAKLRAAVKPTS